MLIQVHEVIVAQLLNHPVDPCHGSSVDVQQTRLRHGIESIVELGLLDLVELLGERARMDDWVLGKHLLPKFDEDFLALFFFLI